MTGCPLLDQVHEGRKEASDFLKIGPEWWAVLLLGNKEMNGKKMPARLEPAVEGFCIFIPSLWVDGAKKSVLEDQIERLLRGIIEEISWEKG